MRLHSPSRLAVCAALACSPAVLAGCRGDSGPTSSASSASTTSPAERGTIRMVDFDFVPVTLDARVGETITWVNDDPEEHQVFTLDGSLRSEKLPTGGRVAHAFPNAGTYEYYCNVHNFMKGTVRVS